MKIKTPIFILLLLAISFNSFSQNTNKYWVFLSDKNGTVFNPLEYFDAKAIERRILANIPIDHISDYPLREDYTQKIDQLVEKSGYGSRWFNAISVDATEQQILEVSKLDFVTEIQMQNISFHLCNFEEDHSNTSDDWLAEAQIAMMQGELFKQNNITGKGIRIAIFDGGFPKVDTHKAFEHIRENNRIIKTWDFPKNREYVYAKHSHGLMVMSNICGIYDNKILGIATESEFLLARTEVNTEPFAEEEWWLAAAEWADKNGAHIINSSLGYTYHRYFPEQMDGQTSLVARAATMAAKKGILVVNAMGNDGTSSWKAVGTPADADSVLSVGGISPKSFYKINFSSFGPTADGRRKPNVINSGTAKVASKNGITKASGTSFAAPLTTGFAACVWQMFPEKTNMEIFEMIEKSGSLYPYYDYAHGFGVPQASYFTESNIQKNRESRFEIEIDENNKTLNVQLSKTYSNIDVSFLDKKTEYYLYYHIENEDGKLSKYELIDVTRTNSYEIDFKDAQNKSTVRVLYKGYIYEYNVKQ